jgi:2-oxoglutarate ferredoxin oxidoreductase subunit gamma
VSDPRLYHELLIAGFGGQGVVLAGKLVAMAALAENREVVWAPSYGPEMRGGPVHCTIIVSEGPIGSPEVSLADSLLVMDLASMARFRDRIKPGGLLVLNSSLVPRPADLDFLDIVEVPATETAEALGDTRVANVIMLGAFLALRPILSPASIVDAMRTNAGKSRQHLVAINQAALEKGATLVR